MNAPRRFAYGPRRTGIAGFAVFFGAIAVFMALRAVHCGPIRDLVGLVPLNPAGANIYYWVRVGLNLLWCAVFAGLALLYLVDLVARLTQPRMLDLAADALLLPYGFLQKRTRRIAYSEIRQVRERIFGRLCTLQITTAERTSEISTLLLPNAEDYRTIKDFMLAHAPATVPEPVRRRPAVLLSREEFLSRQAEAEDRVGRRIIPFGINYSVMVILVPVMLGLVLFQGVLPFADYPPEVRAAMQVRSLWILLLCGLVYGGALLAIRAGTRRFARLAFKCPCCGKHLMFIPGKASLKTGDCVHCGEPVFY